MWLLALIALVLDIVFYVTHQIDALTALLIGLLALAMLVGGFWTVPAPWSRG